jgi:hypothetical protein
MAAIRLSDGQLFLYSPVFLDPELRARLDRLGTVAFVVSPNKIHNLTLAEYRDSYPHARLYAPPGLPERRPDLSFDAVLTDTPEPPWQQELDQALTQGNVFFSEALFLHRRSRTLLVGDLVEDIQRETASGLARAAASLFGVRPRPMASPEFRFYTHDPEAAEAALSRVKRWEFERIFLCHGRPIVSDAQQVFEEVCDELIEETRRRGSFRHWLLRQLAKAQ